MYVYLVETKAVHSSDFPALFYLTLVLSAILIRSTTWIYGGDRVCADSKHVFWFTSLLVPRIAKSWAGGLGTRQRIRLGAQLSRVFETRTFLRGLDDVCQLLHGVGQLLYEVNF